MRQTMVRVGEKYVLWGDNGFSQVKLIGAFDLKNKKYKNEYIRDADSAFLGQTTRGKKKKFFIIYTKDQQIHAMELQKFPLISTFRFKKQDPIVGKSRIAKDNTGVLFGKSAIVLVRMDAKIVIKNEAIAQVHFLNQEQKMIIILDNGANYEVRFESLVLFHYYQQEFFDYSSKYW